MNMNEIYPTGFRTIMDVEGEPTRYMTYYENEFFRGRRQSVLFYAIDSNNKLDVSGRLSKEKLKKTTRYLKIIEFSTVVLKEY